MTGIALIVLASGLSRRFEGGNKLLANLNEKPVAQHVIDAAGDVDFKARYAIVWDKEVKTLFEARGFICIHNEAPEKGQGNSLALGARRALGDGFDTALIMLADMPFVTAAHLQALLRTKGKIAMSEYEGRLMPPSRFSGGALDSLTGLSGDKGGKSTISLPNVATIALSQSAARDIDTREDLDKAL